MKKSKRMTALERTAIHEAGHAVSSVINRVAFNYVTIEPDPEVGSLGHIKHPPHSKQFCEDVGQGSLTLARRDQVECEVIVCLAGAAAINVVRQRYAWKGTSSDREGVVDLLSASCGPEDLSAYFNWLCIRSFAQMKFPVHSAAVRAVADKLLERRRLGSKAVRKIIADSTKQLMAEAGYDTEGQP